MVSSSRFRSACHLLCTFVAAATKVEYYDVFWSEDVFREDAQRADTLVLVWDARSLGRSALDKAVRKFQDKSLNVDRAQKLVVASCRGCPNFDAIKQMWHLEDSDLPVAVLFPGQQEHAVSGRFRLDLAGIDDPYERIMEFIRQYDARQLRAWTASRPVPSLEEQAGAVFEVVGSTYTEEVLNMNKSVLIFIYSPWCGWSKKAERPYTQVAERVGKSNPLLRFVKLDWLGNDIPPPNHISVHGVPAVHLLPNGHKDSPKKFFQSGNLAYDDLLRWLTEEVDGLKVWLNRSQEVDGQEDSALGDIDKEEF